MVAIATENKMDMNERITITPWFSQEEWLNVACCIITATDPVSADKYLQDKHRIKDHINENPAVLYHASMLVITNLTACCRPSEWTS